MVGIDIVSGFLGAGKTTFIRRFLKSYESEKVVLIENEFGDIGIDGDVAETDGFEVVELEKGCICCNMKLGFQNTIYKVIEDLKPDRIIIEPTGMALLSEIIGIIHKLSLKEDCKINSISTVVDGENYLGQVEVFGSFFEDQIANAWTLAVSKTQLLNSEEVKKIMSSLKNINSKAYILIEEWNKIENKQFKEILQLPSVLDIDKLFHDDSSYEEIKEIGTYSLKISKEYSKENIEYILNSLRNQIYGNVLRAKGFLKGVEETLEFNYVNGQYNINTIDIESEGKLCIIGKSLNRDKINLLFKNEIKKFNGVVRR